MDGDRKYRQNGYQDNGSRRAGQSQNGTTRESARELNPPPRHTMDITAPRTPRLVRNVTATRCYDCTVTLAPGHDFAQPCPKCGTELHCCKQCAHFDSSAHFQCAQPVPDRIASKDSRNECELFSARVTVARDTAPPPAPPKPIAAESPAPRVSRSVHNAREAFENLFKK